MCTEMKEMNESLNRMTSPGASDTTELPPASAGIEQIERGHTANPFSCNVCKRSYTRVDHLARHYRSHTLEKPFTCEICNKNFARVDLLKRHTAGHNDEPGNKRQKTSQKATLARVSQACIACGEAKLRCEGSNPCARCQHKDIVCEYAQPRKKKKSMNISQPGYDVDDSGQNGSQVGNALQAAGSVSSASREIPHGMNSRLHQESILTKGMDHMPTDQSGIETGTGDQATLDLNELPANNIFDQSIMPMEQQYYEGDSMMTFDDLPLVDFLRDVMIPTAAHGSMRQNGSDGFQPFPRDVLDFNIDPFLELTNTHNMQYMFTNEQQSITNPALRLEGEDQSGNRSGFTTPGVRRSISLGTQAFKESIWLWTPAQDDHGFAEQLNLSLPYESIVSETEGMDAAYPREQLLQAARDRILAMVLSTCDAAIFPRVVTCFPSAELLTNLFHNFMSFHLRQEVSWIHPATLNINGESPEFLAGIICSGATISRVPELRKLGFAIQEAVRLYMPTVFEADNRSTRKLRALQAYALHLDVGLWSGDRRKMEIAESFALPLVTMVRRAGHFRRPRRPVTAPQQGDDARTIESKWHSWVESESFKRLALNLFTRDTRTSMSLIVKPLISHAELSADLPFSKDLWFAKTATEWKNMYLTRCADMDDRLPSIRACIDDASPIFKYQHIVDVQMTLVVILSSIWSLIWQYREMKTTAKYHKKDGLHNSALTANSLHHEISHLMQHLTLNITEWDGAMMPAATLLHELCLMHLHVSLEDVQLLAGKEGEEEARKAFPILSAWAESSECRQAIFRAGQVLKAAKQYRGYMLRDASAVAVYHASLVFWAYSVLSKSLLESQEKQQQSKPMAITGSARFPHLVRLDGEDNPELQRFLVLGKGIPSIRRWADGAESEDKHDVPLSDPMSVMTAITSLLWKKNGHDEKSCPPLVINLSKLMHSLGSAAAGMRRK